MSKRPFPSTGKPLRFRSDETDYGSKVTGPFDHTITGPKVRKYDPDGKFLPTGTKFDDPNYDPWDSVAKEMISGDTKATKEAFHETRKYLRLRERDVKVRRQEIVSMEEMLAEVETLTKWFADAQTKIEMIDTSIFHRLRQAHADGNIFTSDNKDVEHLEAFMDEKDLPQIFLMQHDWAGVLSHAADDKGKALGSSGDNFRLPFPKCCFEFKMSGRRFCCLFKDDEEDGRASFIVAIECNKVWFIGGECDLLTFIETDLDEREHDTDSFILDNIAALCICLDAEVLTKDVIRAPHKLNVAREKLGKVKLLDHHVVSLSRRYRSEPIPDHTSDGSRIGRTRLHFRRGHWRHFADHKTWIRWMLVGNPDLGFVDKDYKA